MQDELASSEDQQTPDQANANRISYMIHPQVDRTFTAFPSDTQSEKITC
jgi:hypothetical protein